MKASEPIRVVVVDDHESVRSGIRFMLLAFDDLVLAGEAASGEEALLACQQLDPDVVLMDMMMPEIDGIMATRAIRERHPTVQVLGLTSFFDPELVQGALEAGAIGYLLKGVSMDELTQAIRAAHKGEPTLSKEASQALEQAASLGPKPEEKPDEPGPES
jgi:NarL family two-component system response regulator LiaR